MSQLLAALSSLSAADLAAIDARKAELENEINDLMNLREFVESRLNGGGAGVAREPTPGELADSLTDAPDEDEPPALTPSRNGNNHAPKPPTTTADKAAAAMGSGGLRVWQIAKASGLREDEVETAVKSDPHFEAYGRGYYRLRASAKNGGGGKRLRHHLSLVPTPAPWRWPWQAARFSRP